MQNFLFAQAPGCPNVDAGGNQNLNCTTNCTTLNANIFQSGATTSYSVSSIPYSPPFPFTGGTQIFINQDDVWSGIVNLPFNFCFYGNMYNQAIIGANGLISFNTALANNLCQWQFSASIPTPGPPPVGIYNNSINGAYHDMDPSAGGTLVTLFPPVFSYPADINHAVLGTAPCRTFVINWSTVPHYQCTNLRTTQQIVLYETTNAIEVYIQNKPTCNSWNSGNAVIGLQNATGTQGITPPGRNTGNWSTSNEAWRFTPNGAPNWNFAWYDENMNVLGSTLSLNVCPTGTATYTARGTYAACDGSTVIVEDQVTVNIAGGFTSSLSKTDESCAGCDGSVTVSTTGGTPPFTYDVGNGPQANPSFTGLCSGTYSVAVQDNANCSGTLNVIVEPASAISVTSLLTNETCLGANDGTVALTATGGNSPYTYSIGAGVPNTTGIFTGLAPNTYSYSATDATGCSTSGSVTIPAGAAVIISATPADASCGCDGSISISASGGDGGPYQYSIDGGVTFQSGNTFTDLCGGSYMVVAGDGALCTGSITVNVGSSSGISISSVQTINTSCFTGCDAAITILATGALEYSIDNGVTFQTGNQFTNLCAGSYNIVARDANNCVVTENADLAEPPELSVALSPVDASCGNCNGQVQITAQGGTTPYSYTLSGASPVSNNLISSICAGSHTLSVNDANNCSANDIFIIGGPPLCLLHN